LLPAYEDALARVYDPDQIGRMEAAVREVLDPGIADRVVSDEAWTRLASRLTAHEARGSDVRAQLAAAVRIEDTGPDSAVESFARIYHHRIGAPVVAPGDSDLPSWVTPPPARAVGGNREVRDWLLAQAGPIRDRTTALIDAAAGSPEPWSTSPRLQPEDASWRRAWRCDLGSVLAFRDLNQITDAESPLGAARPDDDAYQAAAASLERLRSVEDVKATEARCRTAELRERLAGAGVPRGSVDAADRVRQIRDRDRDIDAGPEQQAVRSVPIRPRPTL